MTRASWEAYQREEQDKYTAVLDRFDPDRIGMRIVCPGCGGDSWLKLSEKRYAYTPLSITCPRACGAYGLLEIFSPSACAREDTGDFDIDHTCRSDGSHMATNGAVFRCPVCAIENPRDIIRDLKAVIARNSTSDANSNLCADMIAKVMSTFDGVMRASNKIAVTNAQTLGKTHPAVTSFQNVAVARARLLPWDMAAAVSDWSRFVLIVQKRHLFAHTLGVADQDYLKKSGDTVTPLGKKVTLTRDDVDFFADATEKIVVNYFGHFLS